MRQTCLDCGTAYDDVKNRDDCPHAELRLSCHECGAIGNHSSWCSLSRVHRVVLGRWISEGVCGSNPQHDPFGAGHQPKVFAMCRACPVRRQCAQYAIDAQIDDGVWGGLDSYERRRVRTGAVTLEEAFGG